MKPGRNDKCPCGSGKKYKQCCKLREGALTSNNHKPTTTPLPEQIRLLGRLFNAGLFAELERQAYLLINLYPNSGICWKALGVALQAQGKDGLEVLQKTSRLLPDDAETHRNLGITLQNLGRLTEAEASHRRAIALRPNLAEAHKNLGIVLKDQGKLSEAETCFRNALKIQPDYFDAQSWLGNILFDQGQFTEAEASNLRALEIMPNSAETHRNLALSLKEQGRLPEAESLYRRALEIKPGFAYAHYELGNLLKEQERWTEAAQCFKSYLAIEPDDPQGSRLLLASLGVESLPPRASEAQIDTLYTNRAGTWDKNNATTPYRGAELVAQLLKKLSPNPKIDCILDAGCGTGLVGVLVQDITIRLDGVDMSSAMLIKARERNIYDKLVQGDLEAYMNHNPEQYDAITCAATLIHFSDLSPVFSAAATCLKDNGLFVFTLFPNNNESDGQEVIVAELNELARGGCFAHGRNYVRRIAGDAGFIVEVLDDEIHEFHEQKPIMGLLAAIRRRPRSN